MENKELEKEIEQIKEIREQNLIKHGKQVGQEKYV